MQTYAGCIFQFGPALHTPCNMYFSSGDIIYANGNSFWVWEMSVMDNLRRKKRTQDANIFFEPCELCFKVSAMHLLCVTLLLSTQVHIEVSGEVGRGWRRESGERTLLNASCLHTQHAAGSPEEQRSRLEGGEYEKTTRRKTKKIALC